MPYEFKLPDLGEGIAEVELRKWLVKEGDRVAEHQTLLEVESDKAVVEVPSPSGGIVARIHRREGETVRVGETLITINGAGEGIGVRPPSVGIVGVLPEEEAPSAPLATPQVRKIARERGIDLQSIRGSGPMSLLRPKTRRSSSSITRSA